MAAFDEPSAADRPENVAVAVREADLERVLSEVPRGALALCGLAVALMLVFWLAIYFGVFLPRGPVS
jgi:Cytochrome c oxidase subunit IIa family